MKFPRAVGRWLLLLGVIFGAVRAHAHPSPNTAVLLDFQQNGVALELTLPLIELELSFNQSLAGAPAEVLPRDESALREYVLAHVHPVTADGRPWQVSVRDFKVKLDQQPVDLVVSLWTQPPPNAPVRRFTLNYDVILHEVVNHRAFVFVRSDWNRAKFSDGAPEALALFYYEQRSLQIDRTGGSWWAGFRSILTLGMHHIAEGTDHLLFLFVLLLPAPLLVAGKRWGEFGGLKRSGWRLFSIVTAFTIGHSTTLLVGAMDWFQLSSQPVEVLIAVSILVSAVHAIRPLFPGREPLVAAGFGLVHGLAFAGIIAHFKFSTVQMLWSILGFNLGIELMQLAVVGITIPWLILLSRTSLYPAVRVIAASCAGIAALAWIGERALAIRNPLEPAITFLAQNGLWLVALLAAISLFATWRQTRALAFA